MAKTYAVSRAIQRIDLIIMQYRIALRRSVRSIDATTLSKIELGLRNGWIKTLHIYALDGHEMCHAELTLSVDWNEYSRQISQGRVTVAIDERWENDTAIEVDEVVNIFGSFVTTYSLRTEWSVSYTDEIYANPRRKAEVEQQLGFVDMQPVKWAGDTSRSDVTVPELNELRVFFRYLKK
jgi:hypothetical protein